LFGLFRLVGPYGSVCHPPPPTPHTPTHFPGFVRSDSHARFVACTCAIILLALALTLTVSLAVPPPEAFAVEADSSSETQAPSPSTAYLEQVITDADSIAAKVDGYTAESVQEFQKALRSAKAVANDQQSTQAQVDTAAATLEDAMGALESRPLIEPSTAIGLGIAAVLVVLLIVLVVVLRSRAKKKAAQNKDKLPPVPAPSPVSAFNKRDLSTGFDVTGGTAQAAGTAPASSVTSRTYPAPAADTAPTAYTPSTPGVHRPSPVTAGANRTSHEAAWATTKTSGTAQMDDETSPPQGTAALRAATGGTAVLGAMQRSAPKAVAASLVRESTGEEVQVSSINALVIGSDPSQVDLIISDNTTVSRRHASIVYGESSFCLEDLASTNGTFLNGNRLSPHTPTPLTNGDTVVFSNERFSFRRRS
ncbi:MAG: FHA domain-containing protein, partial [Coriobacteriales bacterium]|jgi:hypothetical protein|nr:FHA domain-containing protein [Coriobacteriales bacterium]